MPDFDLQAFFPYRINVLASLVSRRLGDVYKARFGITVPEWRALAHLSQEEAVSIRELHARIDVGKAMATRACQRLVKRGLVHKRTNVADRRLVVLSLTTEGQCMVADIVTLAGAFEAELLAALPADQCAALERAITTLCAKLDSRV